MKFLVKLAFLFIVSSLNAQTFSRILPPLDSSYNYLMDMEVLNDTVYISSYHCRRDAGYGYGCTHLSRLDTNGDFDQVIQDDSLFNKGTNNLNIDNGQLNMSGLWMDKSSSWNPLAIMTYDKNLNLVQKKKTHTLDGEAYKCEGIVNLGDTQYLYGVVLFADSSQYSESQIMIDRGDYFDDIRYARATGPGFNECDDLQVYNDTSLVYINSFFDRIGAGDVHGTQIVVVDTNGTKIDSFETPDFDNSTPYDRIEVTDSGAIYFFANNHPYWPQAPYSGRRCISKLEPSFDTIEWSLPFNTIHGNTKYNVFDITQANNGDVLVCGIVFNRGDNLSIESEDNMYVGFVTRISSEGELVWQRLFRTVKDSNILPYDQYGKYRTCSLWKIKELSDGRIAVGGVADVKDYDVLLALEEAGKPQSDLWFMMLNSDGCIEGEECQGLITLDGENKPSNVWRLGATWQHCITYDTASMPYSVTHQVEIVDTTTSYDGLEGYLLKGNFITYKQTSNIDSIWLYRDEHKIYYEMYDSLHLLYDYDYFYSDTMRVTFPHVLDPSFRELYPDRSDVLEWGIQSYGPIKVGDRYRINHKLKPRNDDGVVQMGTSVTEDLGFDNWIFPYMTPESSVDISSELSSFESSVFSYQNEASACFDPSDRIFGVMGSVWHHCLVLDGIEGYTVDINTEVIDTFSLNGLDYSVIRGNFFGNISLPALDTHTVAMSQDQVYYLENDSLYLLYDFDVEQGDTLTLRFPVAQDPEWFEYFPNVSEVYKISVDSVGIVNIDGQNLRRVYIDVIREADISPGENTITPTDLGDFYTEKFGYENFIFPYVVTGYDENNTGCDLKTYSDPYLEYDNPDAYCKTVNTLNTADKAMDVYPNPTKGILHITNVDSPVRYAVYNTQGALLKQGISTDGILKLTHYGVNIIRLSSADDHKVVKVYNINKH